MNRINFRNKKIILAPLDWGLGHAARCVPLVKHLQDNGNIITIACTKKQRDFYERELHSVLYEDMFGYGVNYPKTIPLFLTIALQLPRIFSVIKRENKWLKKYYEKHRPDLIISDNRFGFYHLSVESIFITHQLHIRPPFFEKPVNSINHSYIKKFQQVWVPDMEDENISLSGRLSHPPLKNTQYIGPLSRFKKEENAQCKFDVLVLLSGPEPQRSLLEEKLVSILAYKKIKTALVRGTNSFFKKQDNFFVKNLANTEELQELLLSSEKIICRSGYSTLMDLHAVNKKALLIPTPGQTEQEYLAAYWQEKFGFEVLQQGMISEERISRYLNS